MEVELKATPELFLQGSDLARCFPFSPYTASASTRGPVHPESLAGCWGGNQGEEFTPSEGLRWTETRRRNICKNQHGQSINSLFMLHPPNRTRASSSWFHLTNKEIEALSFSVTSMWPWGQSPVPVFFTTRPPGCRTVLGEGPGTGRQGGMEPSWPLDQPESQTQTPEQVPTRPLEGQSLPFKSSDDLCSQLLSSLQSIFS